MMDPLNSPHTPENLAAPHDLLLADVAELTRNFGSLMEAHLDGTTVPEGYVQLQEGNYLLSPLSPSYHVLTLLKGSVEGIHLAAGPTEQMPDGRFCGADRLVVHVAPESFSTVQAATKLLFGDHDKRHPVPYSTFTTKLNIDGLDRMTIRPAEDDEVYSKHTRDRTITEMLPELISHEYPTDTMQALETYIKGFMTQELL
jgi:hypothetical protein